VRLNETGEGSGIQGIPARKFISNTRWLCGSGWGWI
jgi:hypothetical protein